MKRLPLFCVLLFTGAALARECQQLVSSEVTGPHTSTTDSDLCREFASTLERRTCMGDSGLKTSFTASIFGENCTDSSNLKVSVCGSNCGSEDARRTVTATLSCDAKSAKCAFEYEVYECGVEVAECIRGGQCVDCRGKEVDHKFCPHEQVRRKCVDDTKGVGNKVTNKPARRTGDNYRLWALIATLVVMVTGAGAAVIGILWYRHQRRNKVEEEGRRATEAYSNYTYPSEVTMEPVYDGGPGKHQDLQQVLTSVMTSQIADRVSSQLRSSQARSSKTEAS